MSPKALHSAAQGSQQRTLGKRLDLGRFEAGVDLLLDVHQLSGALQVGEAGAKK